MRDVTAIEPHWLMNLAPHLCTQSAPLDYPSPLYVSLFILKRMILVDFLTVCLYSTVLTVEMTVSNVLLK